MRLFLKSLLCSFVISSRISMTGFCSVCENLQNDVFRLHIIANSDSEQDQSLKLKIRDGILEYTSKLFAECKDRDEAIIAAKENLEDIKRFSQDMVYTYGYGYKVDAYITEMDFDTRIYEDFTMPAGKYQALRIVIGNGNGHNWWCMLYPALCIPSAQQNKPELSLDENEIDVISNSDKYEVKFRLVEIFEAIRSFFE